MNVEQIRQLLDTLHVVDVFRDESVRRLFFVIAEGGRTETLSVSQLKERHSESLRDVDGTKHEVQENKFAEPIAVDIPLAGKERRRMLVLKKDEQLTPAERQQKSARLADLEKEARFHRLVIAGINHLQIHYKELLPLLTGRPSGENAPSPAPAAERIVWSKGLKLAARACSLRAKEPGMATKPLMEICREFLVKYVIEEDPAYTPEQLYNNVLQLHLLDGTD